MGWKSKEKKKGREEEFFEVFEVFVVVFFV